LEHSLRITGHNGAAEVIFRTKNATKGQAAFAHSLLVTTQNTPSNGQAAGILFPELNELLLEKGRQDFVEKTELYAGLPKIQIVPGNFQIVW
jgi:hypothetical protein